jgi:Bifunctional DNA primase/polymerase, N-terminal
VLPSRAAEGSPVMSAILGQAAAAVDRGWHVFPVKDGGKEPRAGWKWAQWHTTDRQRIADWWKDGGNIIDLDVGGPMPPPWDTVPGVTDGSDIYTVLAEAHEDSWPDTYTVSTPRGGWHFYFQAGAHGIRNSAGQIAPMIDVRADGGFVVAAGSVRPEGAYELINDSDPAPLPVWLAGLALKVKHEPPRRAEPVTPAKAAAYVHAAVEAEAQAVAQAPQGERNDQLNKSAYSIARFVQGGQLGADAMTEVLTAAALRAGLTAAEARRTIGSALKSRHT